MTDKLSYMIRGAIFEVHKTLGPGLFEECYHQSLLHELRLRGLEVKSKQKLPIIYKGLQIRDAYELDLIVEDKIIIELKSVEALLPIHHKQLQNYLHIKDLYIGFLVNFNSAHLIEGTDIKRVFNNEASDKSDI